MKIPGFIYMRHDAWDNKPRYGFSEQDMSTVDGYTTVCPHALEFDLPDAFNPTQAQVELLKRHEQELRAKFQERINQIHNQISKLQALEYTA